jgi:hypothetical protein
MLVDSIGAGRPRRKERKMVRRLVILALLTMALLVASIPPATADDVQRRGRRCSQEFGGVRACAFLLVNYTLHTIRAFGEVHNNRTNDYAWLNNVALMRGGRASAPSENRGDAAGPGQRKLGYSRLHFCESSPQAYRSRISMIIPKPRSRRAVVNWESDLAKTTCRY